MSQKPGWAEGLTSLGESLNILYNDSLVSLNGLEGLTSIGGDIWIGDNESLTNITGLQSLTTIGECIWIHWNGSLVSLNGLEGLTVIGGGISIGGNESLTNITGLKNLTAIGGSMNIGFIALEGGVHGNPSLTSLSGLENVGPASIDSLMIIGNDLLTNCDVQSICDYLSAPGGTITIHDNATGCNSQEEIVDFCSAGVTDIDLISGISIYPNPAYQELNISAGEYSIDELIIYTLTGQQVMQERPVSGTVDISDLQPGMYIVEVTIENTKVRHKLLVQR